MALYFPLFCFLPLREIKVYFLLQKKKPQAVMACASAQIYNIRVNKKEV